MTMRWGMRTWWAWFGLAAGVAAQEPVFAELPLRVASLRPGGQCVVDRGSRDRVVLQDRVVLTPRGAAALTGRVIELDERTALVELFDKTAAPPIGTRGHVLLPTARLRPAVPPTNPNGPAVADPLAGEPEVADDEWRPGMPLLGRRRPPRPQERPAAMRARVYGGVSVVRTLDGWRQNFVDTGVDGAIDNVDGEGGVLTFHGAFNRSVEFSGALGDDLRLFDLSWRRGGTRFDPWSWQIGRFLPTDVAEFGLLDGVAVGHRSEGGDRFGASLGWLPALDDDMNTFDDLQLAAWYVWNQDTAERVSFALAFQKTWHHWVQDRDLLLLKARVLPDDDWDLSATAWVDFYTSRDTQGDPVQVTRANLFAGRRTNSGGLEFFYDREQYPLQRRRELPQTIQPQTLLEAHVDRASLRLWTGDRDSRLWFARGTLWVDEERNGGSIELGGEFRGLLQARGLTQLALYQMSGSTSAVTGARVQHGTTTDLGQLDLLYELGYVHHFDFPADRDDLLQHRVAGLLTTGLGSSSWQATFSVDATLWDEELSLGVGLQLQRWF